MGLLLVALALGGLLFGATGALVGYCAALLLARSLPGPAGSCAASRGAGRGRDAPGPGNSVNQPPDRS